MHISILAAAAASTALNNTGTNLLIPSTISPGCQSFLAYLNNDPTLASCIAPIYDSTAAFSPFASIEGNNKAALVAGLDSLCSTPRCSDTALRTALLNFNGNCSAELNSRVESVIGTYDSLYMLSPLRDTLCTKDSLGGYCLSGIAAGSVPAAAVNGTTSNSTSTTTSPITTPSNPMSSSSFNIQSYAGSALAPAQLYFTLTKVVAATRRLARRSSAVLLSQPSNATTTSTDVPKVDLTSFGVLPNATTFRSTSLPFLFLSPKMTSPYLCTSCTKSVLATYIAWETKLPHALGLSNSPILGGQGTLFAGVGTTCGAGFTTAIQTLAGSQAFTNGATSVVMSGTMQSMALAVIMGLYLL